jgi:hypothetical protein
MMEETTVLRLELEGLLLEADGTHHVVSIEWPQRPSGGYIKAVASTLPASIVERVPCLDGYLHPPDGTGNSSRDACEKTPRDYRFLSCYVDEEGALNGRPSNAHQPLIRALGMSFSPQIGLHGPLLLVSTNVEQQQDSSIDPYVVQLFDRYASLGDGKARRDFLAAVMSGTLRFHSQ